MTKTIRLALIKERLKSKPKLSPDAFRFIESIKNEDEDLGESNAFGECLEANVDDIAIFNKNEKGLDNEDESIENLTLISPLMYRAGDQNKQSFLNKRDTF
jgi:hypothetical protein